MVFCKKSYHHSCSAGWTTLKSKVDNAFLAKKRQCWNPLIVTVAGLISSFIFCPFYLWSYISDFLILPHCSTYNCRQRRIWLLVKMRPQMRCTHAASIICGTSACHQTWHQRALVIWIALASWCYCFDMAQHYFSEWHVLLLHREKVRTPQPFMSQQYERQMNMIHKNIVSPQS